MEKFKLLKEVSKVYADGGNIIAYLKSLSNERLNTIEDILISYDFQAGSYIKQYGSNNDYFDVYCQALAKIIDTLGNVNSIIEVGVGEATTLGTLLQKLNNVPQHIFGLDLSWSRLKYAKAFLNDLGFGKAKLFTANLFNIPLADNSVDIVYTSHSIEPNGGHEKEALQELYRITNGYLILLEPTYELAGQEARDRMLTHGYVTKLHSTALELGYEVLEHRLFDTYSNPLNPTGLILIRKNEVFSEKEPQFICPVTGDTLSTYNDNFLNTPAGHLVYPVLDDIPCLLKENAVLATHLHTDYAKFKQENNINI